MLNEAMVTGYGFLKADGTLGDLRSWADGSPDWDYYFWRASIPQRLICADSFLTELDYMNRFAAADEQSWGASEAVGLQAQTEMRKLKNPVSRVLIPGLIGSNRVARERRAQLRLLRVAAQYRATGETLHLDDPFGAKLRSSIQGRTLKVWSVGRDRVDDGGKGAWKPSGGPDIVLEVDK